MPTRPPTPSLLSPVAIVIACFGALSVEANEPTGASSAGPRRAPLRNIEVVSDAETPAPSPAIEPEKAPTPLLPEKSDTQAVGEPAASASPTPPTPPPHRARLHVGTTEPATTGGSPKGSTEPPLSALFAWRPTSKTLATTSAGVAIAVGLMLSFVWLLRSMAPKSSRPLPGDVVEVLGRAQLAGKQTTQLVRVGHKLLLVAVTPEGAETLTEVTDPDEVQAILAACESHSGRSSTAAFDQELRRLSSERATPGFLDRAAEGSGDGRASGSFGFADGAFDPRSLAAAYANTPGGRGDG